MTTRIPIRAHKLARMRPCPALVTAVLAVAVASPLASQTSDTTRVSYRTRDIVFVAAGRDRGLAVGDTITLARADSGTTAAVVTAVARRSASAQLVQAAAPVAIGALARFSARPVVLAAVPVPDTVAPAAAGDSIPAAPRRPPKRRSMRGVVSLDQFAQSTGVSGLTTYQTAAGLSLSADVTDAVQVQVRTRARWRGGDAGSLTGLDGFWNQLYRLEARVAPRGAPWSASFGRMVPGEVMALGYLDGARVDVRVAGAHRLGVLGGFVPEAADLGFSTRTRRVGGYWAWDGSAAFTGAVGAAADWADGAHRRTQLAGQASVRPASSVALSLYAAGDVAAAWDSSASGLQPSTAYATLSFPLPLQLRASVSVEAYQAVRLWEYAAVDTLPLPGRTEAATGRLGRNFGSTAVDLSFGAMRRDGEPGRTLRGSLGVSRRSLSIQALAMQTPLAEYASAFARWYTVPRGSSLGVSCSGLASVNRAWSGTATTRLAVRPEVTWSTRGGMFFTLGGELGSFDGHTTTQVHAGVSYHLR